MPKIKESFLELKPAFDKVWKKLGEEFPELYWTNTSSQVSPKFPIGLNAVWKTYSRILSEMESQGFFEIEGNLALYDICCGEGQLGLYSVQNSDLDVFFVDNESKKISQIQKKADFDKKIISTKKVDIKKGVIFNEEHGRNGGYAAVALNNCGSLVDYIILQINHASKKPEYVCMHSCHHYGIEPNLLLKNAEQVDLPKKLEVSSSELSSALEMCLLGFEQTMFTRTPSDAVEDILSQNKNNQILLEAFLCKIRSATLIQMGYSVKIGGYGADSKISGSKL